MKTLKVRHDKVSKKNLRGDCSDRRGKRGKMMYWGPLGYDNRILEWGMTERWRARALLKGIVSATGEKQTYGYTAERT